MPMIRSKQWVLAGAAAVGSLALVASVAHAYKQERIENQFTTKFFSDTVSGSGVLDASIQMASTFSRLNIITATSGRYNSRLSTRCSDGRLLETAPRNKVGNVDGDVFHTCPGNTFPLRIEGAIDDL